MRLDEVKTFLKGTFVRGTLPIQIEGTFIEGRTFTKGTFKGPEVPEPKPLESVVALEQLA